MSSDPFDRSMLSRHPDGLCRSVAVWREVWGSQRYFNVHYWVGGHQNPRRLAVVRTLAIIPLFAAAAFAASEGGLQQ